MTKHSRSTGIGEEMATEDRTSDWISVKDRLPKEGETVLIAHHNGRLRTWVADFKDGNFLELENQWPMRLTEYWQPLPEPPSAPPKEER